MPNNNKIALLVLLLNSLPAFAMQTLDEAKMADVTGRDGITITTTPNVTIDRLIYTDYDGIQAVNGNTFSIASPSAASVVVGDGQKDIQIVGGTTQITIDSDAGAGHPFLNLGVSIADALQIHTGAIYVAEKDSVNQLMNPVQVMDPMTIRLGATKMNIQLGDITGGSWLKIDGNIENGIQISNLGILSQGQFYLAKIGMLSITDTGSKDLSLNGTAVSVSTAGLMITPSLGKELDIAMSDYRVGGTLALNSAAIGDVFISGLVIGGNTLTISGH